MDEVSATSNSPPSRPVHTLSRAVRSATSRSVSLEMSSTRARIFGSTSMLVRRETGRAEISSWGARESKGPARQRTASRRGRSLGRIGAGQARLTGRRHLRPQKGCRRHPQRAGQPGKGVNTMSLREAVEQSRRRGCAGCPYWPVVHTHTHGPLCALPMASASGRRFCQPPPPQQQHDLLLLCAAGSLSSLSAPLTLSQSCPHHSNLGARHDARARLASAISDARVCVRRGNEQAI